MTQPAETVPTDRATAPPAGIARLADLGRRTLVMGILNTTPDSFSDGGRFDDVERALLHARTMVAEGAAILDVGGESTRPGHHAVSVEDEIARVRPVIARLALDCPVPISIDTYKAATARAALEAGAAIVNDVWGLTRDRDIARVAADFTAPVIVMHNREAIDGTLDIVADMLDFFRRAIDTALAAGIPETDVIVDPGIGFGKTFEQNLDALARLGDLHALGRPILLGTSRKSMIGRILDLPADQRLFGTLATNIVGIRAGAAILRVHDVRPHVEAARVTDAIVAAGAAPRAGGKPA